MPDLADRGILHPKTMNAQLGYLRAKQGNRIANATNSHFDGVQPGFGGIPDAMQFTDNVTHSTTYGNSLEEVREKLNKMRKEFGK